MPLPGCGSSHKVSLGPSAFAAQFDLCTIRNKPRKLHRDILGAPGAFRHPMTSLVHTSMSRDESRIEAAMLPAYFCCCVRPKTPHPTPFPQTMKVDDRLGWGYAAYQFQLETQISLWKAFFCGQTSERMMSKCTDIDHYLA